MVHTFNAILLSYWKEHFWIGPNEVDEARVYYTEGSKSERGKQVSYTNAYTQNLENGTDETICRAAVDTDTENRLMDTAGWGEGGMGGGCGESNRETTLPYVKDSQWEFAVWLREHKPGLGYNLEG